MGRVIYPKRKGTVIQLNKSRMYHDVRVIDPTPIWIVTVEGSDIKRYMSAEEAEQWIKGDPENRRLRAFSTAGNLQQL